jgi:hypothetical protein
MVKRMVRKESESIAREVLPIRNIGSENDADDYPKEKGVICRHDMFQIACGWYKRDNDDIEKEEARKKILRMEDWWMINGDKDLDLIGINDTNTVRHNLLSAIKEFKPDYIITSSKWLNIKDIDIYYSEYVTKYVHYLGFRDPKIAEFVISEDISQREDFKPDKDGKIFKELAEWACIEIHEPDAFVKVCR